MPTETPAPTLAKWRELSGLTLDAEKFLQGRDRRAAIRKLHAAAESEIRAELQLANDDADFKSERSFLWEPIPAVCRKLEISQSALTRFLKELTGMSATQLADKIRAEGLTEKLRADLIAHVQKFHDKPGKFGVSTSDSLHDFWQELKVQRARPNFSYATRAIALGFVNYTRLYRACILQYGLTPSQLEDEILRDFAKFFACASKLISRREAAHSMQKDNKDYDKYRQPYADAWAQALKDKPDWVNKNRELFGLGEAATAWL